MRTFLFFAVTVAWFGCDGARAQTPTPRAPDCIIKFSFDATGAPLRTPSAGFPNKVPTVQDLPCTTWAMNYQAPTSVTNISIELDSAPDTAGAAGAWGAFAGTVIVGTANPMLLASLPASFLARQGAPAWVSVRLNSASGTGTITGAAYGWILSPFSYSSATVTPSGTQDVNLIEIDGNPAHSDSAGNLYNFLACTGSATAALSGTGYTEIVQGTASQVIRVCKVFVTSASGGTPNVNTFSIARATVTTCGTATELVSAAGITGMDSDFGGALQGAASQSICVSEATANGDKVTITYSKF